MEEGQAHIQLKKTDARLDAIIVGDPARIDQVAKFLTDVKNLKYNREFRSICGTYKGKELLVLSTGVGAPSAAIAIEELHNIGVKRIIRVGSAGALQLGIDLGSPIIGEGAVRDDGLTKMYVPEQYPAVPSTDLLNKAKEIATRLNAFNQERQAKEKAICEQVVEQIEAGEKDKTCIILGHEDWHHGIIGIVSSKVTEMYFKPSILICFEGDEGKGSGRSIPGFDLHEALMKCSDTIEKFGGHSMAIGITVKKDKFEEFKQEFEEYAKSCNISEIVPVVQIDEEVNLKDICMEDVRSLKLLEPFGEANKMPIFLFKNLKINSIRALSEGKHLKLNLKSDSYMIDAIGFNMGELANQYLLDDKVDVVGSLDINSFNGNENMQITIKDIRKSY